MDIRRIIESLIRDAVLRCFGQAAAADELPASVEIPRLSEHGDFSTNAAMQLAGRFRRKPRELAAALVEAIRAEDRSGLVRDLEIAGPGFINISLNDAAWREVLAAALREGDRFGAPPEGKAHREKILIEFVSANPTGPLHVGHGRGAAVGDALARILSFAGNDVTTEYYVNDVGNQMDNLGRSLFARYRQVLGRTAELPADGYRGDYLVALAERVRDREGDRHADLTEEEALPVFRREACDRILGDIREDLEAFNVRFDRWFREETLHAAGAVSAVVAELSGRGQTYGADGALYFMSGSRGDEKDRVLVRADGRTTYFAADAAYHRDKFRRGFDRMIDIWGADHHGYAPRLMAALEGLGEDAKRLEIHLVQFVTLVRAGKAVSMSTRSGEFTTLREVRGEVGTDAARFFYLLRSHNSHLDFDLTLAKTESSENPVYYIQYVHARICSIFREAAARGIELSGEPALSVLTLPDEVNLMKAVGRFPDVLSEAARLREPHRIPFYLLDLAREFHGFYHNHRFLGETPERTLGRLALALAVKNIVARGLGLIGVGAPERM